MKRILGIAFAVFAISLPIFAQASSATGGSVSGTVTDSTGAVIAGAKISAASSALLGSQVTESQGTGSYRFPSLTPGLYSFTYEMTGFQKVIREGVTISLGVNTTLDMQLQPGTQSQSVVVTGEAPLVDTANTYVQNTVTSAQLASLPNARDMWSLMASQPGLSLTRFDVGGSTAGTQTTYFAYGLTGQNHVIIDGVNTTEGTSGAGFYYDYGSFAEFQIGTAANDASMPTSGVMVNAIVRSGSNDFHGEMYADVERDNLESHNVNADQFRRGAGLGTRILDYRDDNGNVGGRIKKDKVWFFVSLRDQDVHTTVTGFPVENPTGVFPFETRLQNITYKISSQLSQNHRLSTYLQWGRKLQPSRTASANNYSDSLYKQNSFSWAGNLELSSTFSPKFFVVTRFITFAYDWPNKPYAGVNGVQGGSVVDFRRTDNATNNVAGGYDPFRYNRRRYGVTADGSYFLDNFAGVRHDLKFGYNSEFESLFYEQDGVRDNTELIFNSTAAGAKDFTTPFQVKLTNEPAVQREKTWHHNFYIQDQIKVSKKLTLNVGLRWDGYIGTRPDQQVRPDAPFRDFFYAGKALSNGFSIPVPFTNFQVPANTVFSFKNLIVPRFGAAYDLSGNGKTVVKVNFGVFRGQPATSLGSDTNPIQKATYSFAWNDLNNDKLFQPNELGAFASNSGGANFSVGKVYPPTYVDTSLFVERQLASDLSIRAGFVYKRVTHDWQLVDTARPSNIFAEKKYFCDSGVSGVTAAVGAAANSSCSWQPIWDIPSYLAPPVSRGEYQNPDGNKRDYKNIEFTVNKRMSKRFLLLGNYYYTWDHSLVSTDGYAAGNGVASQSGLATGSLGTSGGTYANAVATNPNTALNNTYHIGNWSAKLNGSYRAPWGINLTPSLRAQQGQAQGRIVQVTSASTSPTGPVAGNTATNVTALRAGGFRMVVEPWGTYRQDNILIVDFRAEKTFNIKERYHIAGILDLYNVTNSNRAQNQDDIVGRLTGPAGTSTDPDGRYQRFLRPTNIIAPRLLRLGVRFTF